MNLNHLEWAKQHDWFVDFFWNAGFVVIVTRGDSPNAVNVFSEFDKLREWAGY